MKEYFIGHYNPRGNHFFAYSIKNVVVNWLDPKPITYRKPNPESNEFKGYTLDFGLEEINLGSYGGYT